jgi:hypothetical protein
VEQSVLSGRFKELEGIDDNDAADETGHWSKAQVEMTGCNFENDSR